jgi:hypothetical protein
MTWLEHHRDDVAEPLVPPSSSSPNSLAIGPEPMVTMSCFTRTSNVRVSEDGRRHPRRGCGRGSSCVLYESSLTTRCPDQPERAEKRDGNTYLPAEWWVHHHLGCSNDDNDVVVIIRYPPIVAWVLVESRLDKFRFNGLKTRRPSPP